MTYVPPDRNGGEESDRTQPLPGMPGAAPLGDGGPGGPAGPFQPDPAPTLTLPADRQGAAEADVGEYAESKPPRDRIVFQVIWEVVLALLTANVLFMLYQRREEVFGDVPLLDVLDEHFTLLAPVLLLVLALGLSLRLGAVNLALPTLVTLAASAPGLFVGEEPWIGLGFTAAAAVVAAAGFVLLVLLLRVPPWLAGIAVSAGMLALVPLINGETFGYELSEAASWESPGGVWLLTGAAVIAVAGGLLGLVPSVRERMSAVKDAVDGPGERRAGTVFMFIGGVLLSSLLAACAGFLLTVFRDVEQQGQGMFALAALPFAFFVSVQLFVFIAVFLAGTSPHGRRGGVFGVLLAVVLVWAVYLLWGSLGAESGEAERFEPWAGLFGFGLLVFALVMAVVLDRLGRPKARPAEEPAQEAPPFVSPQETGPFDPNAPAPGLR